MGYWDRNADWNRDVLERIVVLLFALANLADLAAGAPYFRRRQVLAILSYGEAVARAFVLGMAIGAPILMDAPIEAGDAEAGDAACLAASFRALALVLYAMLARSRQSALPGAVGPRAGGPSHKIFAPAVRWLNASTLPAPDTS